MLLRRRGDGQRFNAAALVADVNLLVFETAPWMKGVCSGVDTLLVWFLLNEHRRRLPPPR